MPTTSPRGRHARWPPVPGPSTATTWRRSVTASARLAGANSMRCPVWESRLEITGLPVDTLWRMQNGYALCTDEGLAAIACLLDGAPEDVIDELRESLAIGLHSNVQVTDVMGERRAGVAKPTARHCSSGIRTCQERMGTVCTVGVGGLV